MPDKYQDPESKSKIESYVLCMILISFTFAILYVFFKDILPVLTDDLNENGLTVIVIGFNVTLFQMLWFALRLSEVRCNPNKEDADRVNNETTDTETAKHSDSDGKMEVNVTVNQSKGGA